MSARTWGTTSARWDDGPVPGGTRLGRVRAEIEHELREGTTAGAQIVAEQHGRTVLHTTVGERRPGVPMTPDTYVMHSCCVKPFVALALARLWERGSVDLDAPLATYLAEFRGGPAEHVTVRDVLAHRSGFDDVPNLWMVAACDFDDVVRQFAAMDPGWSDDGEGPPKYVASAWYLVAAIVERVGGRPIADVVERDVMRPLGMSQTWFTLTRDLLPSVRPRLCPPSVDTGGRLESVALLTSPSLLTTPSPATGGYGALAELCILYRWLLDAQSGDVEGPVSAATIREMTRPQRVGGRDEFFERWCDFGLGFMIDMRGHSAGASCSPRSFGHTGFPGMWSFADPDCDLVVALQYNGTPASHKVRQPPTDAERCATIDALYDDLELT